MARRGVARGVVRIVAATKEPRAPPLSGSHPHTRQDRQIHAHFTRAGFPVVPGVNAAAQGHA